MKLVELRGILRNSLVVAVKTIRTTLDEEQAKGAVIEYLQANGLNFNYDHRKSKVIVRRIVMVAEEYCFTGKNIEECISLLGTALRINLMVDTIDYEEIH